MKSTEVYRSIRDIISPWCKANDFKRTKSGMLGWYRQTGDHFLVFWFQCSMDGWDKYAGSKFVVEFQLADEAIIGVGKNRERIQSLLDRKQLIQVRQIQNEVVFKLNLPTDDYPVFHISPDISKWYLAKFKPVKHNYNSNDDIWFRYHSVEDVERWAAFILEHLPVLVTRFDPEIRF